MWTGTLTEDVLDILNREGNKVCKLLTGNKQAQACSFLRNNSTVSFYERHHPAPERILF